MKEIMKDNVYMSLLLQFDHMKYQRTQSSILVFSMTFYSELKDAVEHEVIPNPPTILHS